VTRLPAFPRPCRRLLPWRGAEEQSYERKLRMAHEAEHPHPTGRVALIGLVTRNLSCFGQSKPIAPPVLSIGSPSAYISDKSENPSSGPPGLAFLPSRPIFPPCPRWVRVPDPPSLNPASPAQPTSRRLGPTGFIDQARRLPADGGIRLLTRRGNDWSDRFPLVVEAVNHLRVRSVLIDGEVACCAQGTSWIAPQRAPRAPGWPDSVPARMQDGGEGDRVQAPRLTLSIRPIRPTG